ncbi:MAG TPA: AsmA family protein [Gammaproteobacteria bacterium]
MGRILKILGIVAGAVVVLVVAALVAVGLLVDPNDYKDQITAAVARATGRELTLTGDLDLELFPTVRIAVGEASLSNAPGFGDQPFARIASAELAVAILPLLSRRIEVDEARLSGLELNLARDAQGRNNWQDMAGGQAPQAQAPAPEQGGGAPDIALDAGAIEIENARVTWSDAASGSRWELTDFDMEAEGFGPGRAFPLEMSFALAGEDVNVRVTSAMQATISLADNAYRLADLDVQIAGTGPGWPGGAGQANLRVAALGANLNDETLSLEGLELEALGLGVSGNLRGTELLSNLALSGDVEIAEFNPRDLLQAFEIALETADPDALARASARAEFVYDANQVGLRNMSLQLDDSELTGEVGMRGEQLRFDLAVNQINIDRYLPPPAEGEAAPAEDEGSLDEVDLPLEALRTLNAEGRLALEQTRFIGLTLTGASFALSARDGRVSLVPQAMLYGGQYSGEVTLEVQADAARATLVQQLENVDMLPLGRDLLDSEMVSGTGTLTLDLASTGSNLGQMRRDLDGDVSFTLRDGAWEGFDLWYELRRAKALFDRADTPERPEGPRRTPFSTVSATGAVQDAILMNRDLTATLPFMTITGAGTANLLDDSLNFDLVARFTDGPALQSDPAMAGLAGQELPLKVGGTVAEPSVLPDFAALVRSRVQSEVRDRVEEERSGVQEEVEQEREEIRERVRDRLRGILER